MNSKPDYQHPTARRSDLTWRNWITVEAAFWTFFLAVIWGLSASAAADDDAKLPEGLEIVALGDSLTAGYQLGSREGFVPQLQTWLSEEAGVPVRVHNAGVSGDTSAGGRTRLAWSLGAAKSGKPDLVILELGANDALRSLEPSFTRANLTAIMDELQKRNVPVVIAGMQAPPNLGPDFAKEFNSIYPDLARTYKATLYPFFLDGVAANPKLNLADGIHPTAEGISIIVNKIGPVILAALQQTTVSAD